MRVDEFKYKMDVDTDHNNVRSMKWKIRKVCFEDTDGLMMIDVLEVRVNTPKRLEGFSLVLTR